MLADVTTVKVHLVFVKIYEFLNPYLVFRSSLYYYNHLSIHPKSKSRNSRSGGALNKAVLKNFVKFKENCEILNYAKFSGAGMLYYTYKQLLLKMLGYIKAFTCIGSSVYIFIQEIKRYLLRCQVSH